MNELVVPPNEPRIAAFESDAHAQAELEPGSLAELEAQAEESADVDEKIALWVQIDAEVEQRAELGSDAERALSARMLRRTSVQWPGGAPKWLARVLRGPDEPSAKLSVLLSALVQPEVDPAFAEDLAQAAVEIAPDRGSLIETLETFGDVLTRRLDAPRRAAVKFREAAEQCSPDEVAAATRLLDRARLADPEDAGLEQRLVELHARAGNFKAVRLSVRRLAELRPDPVERTALLLSLEPAAIAAAACDEFGSLVDELLPELVSTDAELARALLGAKARVLLAGKRLDATASIYEELIESYADEADVRAYVGLLELGPTPEWRRDKRRWMFEWRAATSRDPVSVMIHWARVEEREFGDSGAACRTLERALEQEPARADVLLDLARLRFLAGDDGAGMQLIARLRATAGAEPSSTRELELARELAELPERRALALELAGAALDRRPNDPEALALLLELAAVPQLAASACDRIERAVGAVAGESRVELLGALLAATESSELEGELSARRRGWAEQVLAAGDVPDVLAALERAAPALGVDPDAWQRVEALALAALEPAAAVRAYERAISAAPDAGAVEWLGCQLVRVVDRHLSDPRALTTGLCSVLRRVPDARWAFERGKLPLTLERRWDDLFPLYDHAIEAERSDDQRAALLDEAAVAARDVAADFERAVGYWHRYLELRPHDGRVDLALERLYERLRQHDRLIRHLLRREPSLPPSERAALRERVAGLELERGDASAALAALEPVFEPGPASDTALEVLERLLALDAPAGAEPELGHAHAAAVRRAARWLHRESLRRGRRSDAARALSSELSHTEPAAERARLLRELYELAEALPDPRQSFECLGELLVLEPANEAHRARLAELARELDALGELAELELRAADAAADEAVFAALLSDAARLELELGRPERALALQQRLFERAGEPALKLTAARAIERLLAERGRTEERCAMLERIAELEPTPENRRAALLESARLALDEIGSPRRAAAAYRGLLEEYPDEPALLDGWVRALAHTEQYDELLGALRARARVARTPAAARDDLAYAARLLADRLGQPDAAIESWRALRAEFGRDAESFEALAALLEARARFGELAELLADEAAAGRGHALLYARLAEIHSTHTGDLRGALAAHVRAGQLDRAAELLCATPALLSDDPAVVLELSEQLAAAGHLSSAERVLRRQLDHYGPRRPREGAAVHLALARVLSAAGHGEQALAELVLAAERHPSNPDVLARLAALSFERDELDRAEQSYQALLVSIPHSPEAAAVTSRAELYLALAAISERRGDTAKAEDRFEWAFEASLGGPAEAAALERGLTLRGKRALLERAIRGRLQRAREPRARLSALGDLVATALDAGHASAAFCADAREQARAVERELLQAPELELESARRLRELYDALDEPELALEVHEALLGRAGDGERLRLELERAERLLSIPERAESGVEQLWSLLQDERASAEAAELLAGVEAGRSRLDELVSTLDGHAARAAADGRARDAAALRFRSARVLEKGQRLDQARQAYLGLSSDEGFGREALRRALALLEALDAPLEQVAEVVDSLLASAEGVEARELSDRLIELADALGDTEYLERGLERGFFADPGRAERRERLLALLEERGEWLRVRDVLERAIEQAPDAELVLRLADAHLQTGAPDRALDLLETVGLRVAPERAVRRRRAATLEAAGRTEAALEELLELNKAYGDATEEIGSTIRRTRLWTDSERWALLAIETSIAGGHEQELTEIVQHWVERGAHTAPLLWQLGELSSRGGDHAQAARIYRRLSDIEQGEPRATALLALARAHEAAGDTAAAIRALETALARSPESDELFRALYELCGRAGERGRQGRLLLDRAERAPAGERAALLFEAADTLSRAGEEFDALEALSRLEALEPSNVEARAIKARVLRRLGRPDEALVELQRSIDAEPRPRGRALGRLYRELADLHLASDELVEAYRALSLAHPLDRADLDTTWLLGVLAFDLGETDAAASALRAFVTLREPGSKSGSMPRVAAAYCRLACIEHDRGQLAASRRMASLALQSDPESAEARHLVAALGVT